MAEENKMANATEIVNPSIQVAQLFCGKEYVINHSWDIPNAECQMGQNLIEFLMRFAKDNLPEQPFGNAATIRILNLFEPTFSVESGMNRIAFWPDLQKRKMAETRETMADKLKLRSMAKPAKAFRRFFPESDESLCTKFSDAYNAAFAPAPYSIQWGTDRESFRFGYNGKMVSFQNPCLNAGRKSLANSCMRGERVDMGETSPAETYASGDFAIAIVTDESGLVAARVVVRTHKGGGKTEMTKPVHAPLYGCTEIALNMLETELARIKAIPAEDNSSSFGFLDARLEKIKYEDSFLSCYSDIRPQSAYDMGEYFQIACQGKFSLSETQGYYSVDSGCSCHNCGCYHDEDEMRSNESGDMFCDDCYSERYSTCDRCDEEYLADDGVTVYSISMRGRTQESTWCPYCADSHATQCSNGEMWDNDDVVESDCGESLSPPDIESGDWIYIDDCDSYVKCHDCAEDESGTYRKISDMVSEGMTPGSNGVYSMPEESESYHCHITPDLFDSPLPLPDLPLPLPLPHAGDVQPHAGAILESVE